MLGVLSDWVEIGKSSFRMDPCCEIYIHLMVGMCAHVTLVAIVPTCHWYVVRFTYI